MLAYQLELWLQNWMQRIIVKNDPQILRNGDFHKKRNETLV